MAASDSAAPLSLELQLAIHNDHTPREENFRTWVETALDAASERRRELTIRVIDEAEIQQLNGDYRSKNQATNVLSFPFESIDDIETAYLGDMVICASVVESEAAQQGKLPEAHWAHMVIHGALHLCGYDHIDPADAEQMEALESNLLIGLGYSDPYLLSNEPQDPQRSS